MTMIFNSNFKLVAKDRKVNEDKGEFALDSLDDASSAVLTGIAKAYSLKVNSKTKKADLIKIIDAHLSTVTLRNTTMSDVEKVKEICTEGYNKGLDEDAIMQRLVADAGIKIKDVGRVYAKTMRDLGFLLTAKQLYEKSEAILTEGDFAPETHDDVAKIAAHLCKENGIENKVAMQHIRKFAKANEIELPKGKPAKKRTSKHEIIGKWLAENSNSTREEFTKFLVTSEAEGGAGVSSEKQANKYQTSYDLMVTLRDAWSDSSDE